MKARHALANVSRSAALVTMATVIIISFQAGVELVFAVLRGMLAFLIVHWVLGAAADVLEVAVFHRRRQRPASEPQPQERGSSPEGG